MKEKIQTACAYLGILIMAGFIVFLAQLHFGESAKLAQARGDAEEWKGKAAYWQDVATKNGASHLAHVQINNVSGDFCDLVGGNFRCAHVENTALKAKRKRKELTYFTYSGFSVADEPSVHLNAPVTCQISGTNTAVPYLECGK